MEFLIITGAVIVGGVIKELVLAFGLAFRAKSLQRKQSAAFAEWAEKMEATARSEASATEGSK